MTSLFPAVAIATHSQFGELASMGMPALDQPTTNPIAPACDFLCHYASQDLAA